MQKKDLVNTLQVMNIVFNKCLMKDNILRDDKPQWTQDYAAHAQQMSAFQRLHAQTKKKITEMPHKESQEGACM